MAVNEQLPDLVDHVVREQRGWWYDIVSENNKSRVVEARRKVGVTRRYEARLLTTELPVINFMIIHNENADRELLFGFGLNDHDMNGYVFSTSDVKLLDTFENYFNALSAFCTPFDGRDDAPTDQ